MPAPSSRYPRSDHYDGRRFFNPGVHTDRGLGNLLRWQRERRPPRWPRRVDNTPYPAPLREAPAGELHVTDIGHVTFLIQVEGCNLLTDPVWSQRASPLPFAGPKRVRAPGVAFDDLPRIDAVLLSHNHYDHLCLRTLHRLHERWQPVILTGLGNGRYLARKGIPGAIELDWWQAWSPRPEVRVTYVPAQHWSSRSPFDRRRMLWGGHVVDTPAGRVYFAGDTGYPPEGVPSFLQGIRKRLGRPDVALLPIGAYAPRWFMATHHMDPDEAVRSHLDLGARLSIGMHQGIFQLTDEAFDEPPRLLAEARARHGVSPADFTLLDVGQRLMRHAGGWSTSEPLAAVANNAAPANGPAAAAA
ncbi:MAG: MBL fold metallo-hydrolase [Pseudomonadota bacterium]